MTHIEHVPQTAQSQNINDELKTDVLSGLSKKNKMIPSKYFYDDDGSALFNRITTHTDYYLTRCELEILDRAKRKIADLLGKKPFNLVELGPGEGIKTEILIDYCLKQNMNFTYIPIDISYQYLKEIVEKLDKNQPTVNLLPINSDYFNGLKWLNLDSQACNFALFLGSSIGNFSIPGAEKFLCHLRENLHVNDYALIGFDLRKDINLLLRAYDDSDGITRAFNLNLLHRINNTLGANFDISKFRHYATYNFIIGAMESYLVSLEPQIVQLPALNASFNFEAFEAIHVECSYKYTLAQIDALAQKSGFKIIENYFDSNGYFVDSLWQAQPFSQHRHVSPLKSSAR